MFGSLYFAELGQIGLAEINITKNYNHATEMNYYLFVLAGQKGSVVPNNFDYQCSSASIGNMDLTIPPNVNGPP
jgi:hypothetical protein